jgi:hypothetical protein
MKLIEYLVPVAKAQDEGAISEGGANFSISDFNFLRPFQTGAGDTTRTFNDLFGNIIGLVLTIAAIVAFFYLIVSGFQYITAGGDAGKAQTARQGIINALIGIVIILISYLVLRYVGTLIGDR